MKDIEIEVDVVARKRNVLKDFINVDKILKF